MQTPLLEIKNHNGKLLVLNLKQVITIEEAVTGCIVYTTGIESGESKKNLYR